MTTKKKPAQEPETLKRARGRPRKTGKNADKTRSITMDTAVWNLVMDDAARSVRSVNGQLEWLLREHYKFYGK